MSQHAPGPWAIHRERANVVPGCPVEGEIRGSGFIVVRLGNLYSETQEADARLIAAAPRMATFLRALDRLWTLQAGHYASLDTDRQELRDILAEIDGVGAKAEG